MAYAKNFKKNDNYDPKQAAEERAQKREAAMAQVVEAFKTAILAFIENPKQILPWRKTWASGGGVRNGMSGRPYSGANAFLLALSCLANGWNDSRFYTYAQIQKWGQDAYVGRGAKSTQIFFFSMIPLKDKDGNPILDSDGQQKLRPLLRTLSVFNHAQIVWGDKQPKNKFANRTEVQISDDEQAVLKHIQGLFNVSWGGDRAGYSPSRHSIVMPPLNQFESTAAAISTLLHEAAHATSQPLKREVTGDFGSEEYAIEELIAEIASCMASSMLGLPLTDLDNSLAYAQSWCKALRKPDSTELMEKVIKQASAASWYLVKDLLEGDDSED